MQPGLHFGCGLEKDGALSFRLSEQVMETFVYFETGSHATQTDLELAGPDPPVSTSKVLGLTTRRNMPMLNINNTALIHF